MSTRLRSFSRALASCVRPSFIGSCNLFPRHERASQGHLLGIGLQRMVLSAPIAARLSLHLVLASLLLRLAPLVVEACWQGRGGIFSSWGPFLLALKAAVHVTCELLAINQPINVSASPVCTAWAGDSGLCWHNSCAHILSLRC